MAWGDAYGALYYRTCREAPRTKVAGFDMDGTLYRWTCRNWPSALTDYALWSERVLTKLRECHESGYKVVIFGNRGQIKKAFGGKNAEKTRWLVNWLAQEAGVPIHAMFATKKDDGQFSKPSIGMWTAMEKHANGGVAVDPAASFFVGDMAGREGDVGRSDLEFALGVGQARGVTMRFETPEQCFGPAAGSHNVSGGGGGGGGGVSGGASGAAGSAVAAPPESLVARAALLGGYLRGPRVLLLCGPQGAGGCAAAVSPHGGCAS